MQSLGVVPRWYFLVCPRMHIRCSNVALNLASLDQNVVRILWQVVGGPDRAFLDMLVNFLFPPISIFILCRYRPVPLHLCCFLRQMPPVQLPPMSIEPPKKNALFSSIIYQLIMFWKFLIVLVNLSQEGHRLKMFRMWFVLRKLPFWIWPMIFGWWLRWPDILKHHQVPNHETHIRNTYCVSLYILKLS